MEPKIEKAEAPDKRQKAEPSEGSSVARVTSPLLRGSRHQKIDDSAPKGWFGYGLMMFTLVLFDCVVAWSISMASIYSHDGHVSLTTGGLPTPCVSYLK